MKFNTFITSAKKNSKTESEHFSEHDLFCRATSAILFDPNLDPIRHPVFSFRVSLILQFGIFEYYDYVTFHLLKE